MKPVVVQIDMRNVRLHVDAGVVLDVQHLHGAMVSRIAGHPPVFDDQRSYTLQIRAAEMSLDMPSLSSLLNRHVFSYPGAPLSKLSSATAGDGSLQLTGKLHKGLTVPFSTRMIVSVTGDGRMRLHVERMKAAGVPAKGVMNLLGLALDDLLDLKNRHDVTVDGDDIIMSPGEALPPPEIRGRLSKVGVSEGRLTLTYLSNNDAPADRGRRSPSPRNHVSFTGGTIRFGKLTMTDADLRLIDIDPRDSFDFFPAQYQRQLIAGYSRNTPAGGLRTFMPDYDDLVAGRRIASRTRNDQRR